MTISDAYKGLDILQKVEQNPELIFTELLSYSPSGYIFLLQVNIGGRSLLDIVKDTLSELPIFSDVVFDISGPRIMLFMIPPTEIRDDQYTKDLIFKFDLQNQSYEKSNWSIDEYNYILNTNYECKHWTVPSQFMMFNDLSCKAVVKNAFSSLSHEEKSMVVRWMDFFFWVSSPFKRKHLNSLLETKVHDVNMANAKNKEEYNRNIERQKVYRQYAPEYIEKITKKQEELSCFLKQYNYTEEIS